MILVDEGHPQILDGEVAGGEQLRVDDHLKLVLPPAHEVGRRHAVDALEAALDVVFRHPADRFDVDGRRRKALNFWMRGGETAEPEEGEVGGAGRKYAVKLRGKRGVIGLGLADDGRVGGGLAEKKPGHGAVVGAGRPDHGAVGVDGPVADLLHPGVDLHERLRHVGADGELEFDRARRTA